MKVKYIISALVGLFLGCLLSSILKEDSSIMANFTSLSIGYLLCVWHHSKLDKIR